MNLTSARLSMLLDLALVHGAYFDEETGLALLRIDENLVEAIPSGEDQWEDLAQFWRVPFFDGYWNGRVIPLSGRRSYAFIRREAWYPPEDSPSC